MQMAARKLSPLVGELVVEMARARVLDLEVVAVAVAVMGAAVRVVVVDLVGAEAVVVVVWYGVPEISGGKDRSSVSSVSVSVQDKVLEAAVALEGAVAAVVKAAAVVEVAVAMEMVVGEEAVVEDSRDLVVVGQAVEAETAQDRVAAREVGRVALVMLVVMGTLVEEVVDRAVEEVMEVVAVVALSARHNSVLSNEAATFVKTNLAYLKMFLGWCSWNEIRVCG